MEQTSHHSQHISKLSLGGLLITLGIIYGDIGTSPLYVMKAIIGNKVIDDQIVLGGLSCVFWTLTLQTTIKYVIITLKADNKGEGGIFSLYALIRKKGHYMIWPAVLGASALLADGMITPPISISSAIEGLKIHNPELDVVPIVITIIIVLFLFQRIGTNIVGKFFGPFMLIWFSVLAIVGVGNLLTFPSVLKAINPLYGIQLLTEYPNGFWILGSVFLCTTGAEALYSDLGHCGRKNIQISWVFVKTALLLNYFGQGAWLLNRSNSFLAGQNPFYEMMPPWFLNYGISIATIAAIIASQALISGSFTLISEAIRLNVWPKVKIKFPSDQKGQLFVPSINIILMLGCIGVVFLFKESAKMEAAYGLAISITMLMTTILLCYYLYVIKKRSLLIVIFCLIVYLFIEIAFLIANMEKFEHMGYVSLLMSFVIASVMWVWYRAAQIKKRLTELVHIDKYFTQIKELSVDESMPKYATHLVYLTGSNNTHLIESKVIYSIFHKRPKKADIYWFIHIDVLDEPYTMEYKVTEMIPNDLIRIDFRLGFRIEQKVNLYFRKVVEDMVKNKEIDIVSRYESLNKRNLIGDFKFIVLEKHLSHENTLPFMERMIMEWYFILKKFSLSEPSAFGLDTSSVKIEKVPLVIKPPTKVNLKRVY